MQVRLERTETVWLRQPGADVRRCGDTHLGPAGSSSCVAVLRVV